MQCIFHPIAKMIALKYKYYHVLPLLLILHWLLHAVHDKIQSPKFMAIFLHHVHSIFELKHTTHAIL